MACAESEENRIEDVVDRINAMRSQEENTVCHNYLTPLVDAPCRIALMGWCRTVADSFDLGRETVGIGMSILDRYLSSGKGRSAEALQSKPRFQLAAVTSFYMAVKLHEPLVLGIGMVVKLCRGLYKESAIVTMEKDILHSLEWCVYVSTTTPLEYVRQFVQLFSISRDAAAVIVENATKHTECAAADLAFSAYKASSVGIACLAGALNDTDALTPLEKKMVWHRLSTRLDFDVASNEVGKVERELLSKSKGCGHAMAQSRASLPRSTSVHLTSAQPSSPISVIEVA